jgi:hypothetical protein
MERRALLVELADLLAALLLASNATAHTSASFNPARCTLAGGGARAASAAIGKALCSVDSGIGVSEMLVMLRQGVRQ